MESTTSQSNNNNTCLYFQASDCQEKYRIIKKIGRGTFSTVYLCEDKQGCQYAMKVHQEQEGINDSKRAIIFNDAEVIKKVQGHPNVIQMKEVYIKGNIYSSEGTKKEVFAVMLLETVKGGELYYHIRQCKKFSLGTSRLFFKQLASAISHMNK